MPNETGNLNLQTQSKMQRKGSDYAKYAGLFAKSEEEKRIANALKQEMESLNAIIMQSSEIDPHTSTAKVLTDNDLRTIRTAYGKIASLTKAAKALSPGKPTPFVKSILAIDEFITKDLNAFETVSGDDGLTYQEAIQHSRDITVNLGNQKTNSVGGAASSRIPLVVNNANGTKSKGMFTKSSEFNPEKKLLDFFKVRANRGPMYQKVYEEICQYAENNENIVEQFISNIQLNYKMVDDNVVYTLISGIYANEGLADILNQFKELEDFNNICSELTGLRNNIDLELDKYRDTLKVQKGSNIDKRNCAMSFVADLMNCPKLIARSTPMTVISDGEKLNGTFMEFADGTDINSMGPEDPYFSTTPESFDGCLGLRDAANLTVLDYICGNIDRHQANLFYKFEGNKLVGVVGIDNDMSFGCMNDKEMSNIHFVGGIKDIKVIGVDAAIGILAINPDVMAVGLKGYGLSDDEIASAIDRLNNVKEAIESKKITPVKDDAWKNYKLNDLAKSGTGVLASVEVVSKGHEEQRYLLEKRLANQKEKTIMPEGARLVKAENLKHLADKMELMYAELKENNRGAFIGSKQYDNILAYTKYAKEEFAFMAQNYHPEDAVAEDEYKQEMYFRTQEILGNLNGLSTMYLDYKLNENAAQKNDRSMNRSLAVLKVRDFSSNNLSKYERSDIQSYRLVSAELRKEAYKQMKPKEIAGAITQMNKLKKDFKSQDAIRAVDHRISKYLLTLKEALGPNVTEPNEHNNQISELRRY